MSISTLSLGCAIPQRIVLAVMGFLAIAIAYAMRVCLSVAITEMVIKPNRTEQQGNGHSVCPAEIVTTNVTNSVRIFRFYSGYFCSHLNIHIYFISERHNFLSMM